MGNEIVLKCGANDMSVVVSSNGIDWHVYQSIDASIAYGYNHSCNMLFKQQSSGEGHGHRHFQLTKNLHTSDSVTLI
ncbi:MAG: hypothetical protein ABJ059_05905, partial [Hyphomicrobiales bacterium]